MATKMISIICGTCLGVGATATAIAVPIVTTQQKEKEQLTIYCKRVNDWWEFSLDNGKNWEKEVNYTNQWEFENYLKLRYSNYNVVFNWIE